MGPQEPLGAAGAASVLVRRGSGLHFSATDLSSRLSCLLLAAPLPPPPLSEL